MYSSTIITHTFLSLLLFQLQDTTTAKDDSRLMRLRAQKRSLADSPLSETFFPSDNRLMPEERSKNELTTASSGSIFLDESDPGQEQIQQSWLHQKPVETMLTACTTTTDESDRSILPSAKFQRRQTTVPNACPPEWKTQPGQQKMKLDGQDQGRGQTIPDTEEGPEREFHPPGELQKWNTYPNALELFRLFTFGRAANPNSVCDEFVGQSIPMCAPSSLSVLESPAAVLAPTRFWSKIDLCIIVIEQFWCCTTGREMDPDRTIDDGQLWGSPVRDLRAPSAYPAAAWSCSRSNDLRAFRN